MSNEGNYNPPPTEFSGDFASAVKAGQQLAGAQLVESRDPYEEEQLIVIPTGMRLESLERFRTRPRRIAQRVTADTLESFLDYYERYQSSGTVIFGDVDKAELTAIFDYHEPGLPQHGAHQLTFSMPPSPEWKAWSRKNEQEMSQRQFGEFVEDNLPDFLRPVGADMLEVARNVQATQKVEFESAVDEHNGNTVFKYRKDTETKGEIEVPKEIEIAIPLYQGGDRWKMKARLRFRIDGGNLKFWFKLERPEHVWAEAFEDVLEKVREFEPIMYLGSPS